MQVHVQVANYNRNSIEVKFANPNEIRLACESTSKSGYVQYYLSYVKFFKSDDKPYELNTEYEVEYDDADSFRIVINKTEKLSHQALVSLSDESLFVEINQDSIDKVSSKKGWQNFK